MNKGFRFDLQVHSCFSWDSRSKVKDIINRSRKIGLSGIAITDHETTRGGLEGYSITRKYDDFTVIPSIEIATQFGDIIAMFVKEEVKVKDFFEIIDLAKDEDMLLMLPHPGRSLVKAKKAAKYMDAVEVINGHSRLTQNIYSYFLKDEFQKTAVAGSDAHKLNEIGTCTTTFQGLSEESIRKDIRLGQTKVHGLLNTAKNIPKSFIKKYIDK